MGYAWLSSTFLESVILLLRRGRKIARGKGYRIVCTIFNISLTEFSILLPGACTRLQFKDEKFTLEKGSRKRKVTRQNLRETVVSLRLFSLNKLIYSCYTENIRIISCQLIHESHKMAPVLSLL